jgi:hypothetical protein
VLYFIICKTMKKHVCALGPAVQSTHHSDILVVMRLFSHHRKSQG